MFLFFSVLAGVSGFSGFPTDVIEADCDVHAAKEEDSRFSPRLAAISVKDIQSSFTWYREVLGFSELASYEFPGEGLKILFIGRNGFELELIEKAGAAPFNAPDPTNPASRRGIGKLAFAVSDLGLSLERAESAGAEFVNSVQRSNRLRGCHLILSDPDGNWIQLFGACPSRIETGESAAEDGE